jgi:VWFA-related protein
MQCRVVGVLLAAFALPAQIRVSTRLVEVNVIVRDKNGPVRDLTLADFSVTDNGNPRPIVSFSVNSLHAEPIPPDPLPAGVYSNAPQYRGIAPGAATVLLLDGVNTRLVDQMNAGPQVRAFLAQIRPEDRVAVYSLGNTLRVLQDFTNTIRLDGLVFAQCQGESAMDRRVNLTVDAIEAIAARLSGIAGRKNLIWVTASFPFALYGRQNAKTYSREINRAARALNSANVAIYPVDARGLVGVPLLNASSKLMPAPNILYTPLGQDTMDMLASATGGRAFKNDNDIRGALRTVLDDSEVTYSLAFHADPDGLDDAFHKIKVRVNRPGLDVRHREGYVAIPDPASSDTDRVRTVNAALASPIENPGIRARVQWAADRLVVSINPADLSPDSALDVVCSQRDADGRELAVETFAVRPQGKPLAAPLRRRDGVSELRLVLYDRSSGRVGSVMVPL